MKVTHGFKIPYDKSLYQSFKYHQKESAKVWNDTLEEATFYFRTNHKWMSKTELQANRKQYYSLHSQTVQAVVDKYCENREATRVKRQNGDKKAKYPWRKKGFFCIPFKKAGFDVSEDKIILKFSEDTTSLFDFLLLKSKKVEELFEKGFKRGTQQIVIPNLSGEDLSNCTYCEVVWRNGSYWFHYIVDVPEKESLEDSISFKVAGGDLGEIHSIAVATEEEALVISGRAIRSIKQWRAKCIAELNKLMSRCKKGSRQWKKYFRAKKYIQSKSENQIKDLLHKTTRQAVDFLEKTKVTHFVLGKVSGIEKGTKKIEKKRKKTTKTRRQQLSTWEHGTLSSYLKYKTQLKGIHFEEVNEAWTSKTCPFCGGRHEPKGRVFYCPVKKTGIARDVNGAQNIARKRYFVAVKDVVVKYKQPVWFKRFLSDYERVLLKHPNDKQKYRRVQTA